MKSFPAFASSGLSRPKPTDKRLTVYALLISPARDRRFYRFASFSPRYRGGRAVVKVYLRDKVRAGRCAINQYVPAWAKTSRRRRPTIVRNWHDSNGLSIHAGNGGVILASAEQSKHRCEQLCDGKPLRIRPVAAWRREFSGKPRFRRRHDLANQAPGYPERRLGKGKAELVEIPTNDENQR